jgi:hypothetical protein
METTSVTSSLTRAELSPSNSLETPITPDIEALVPRLSQLRMTSSVAMSEAPPASVQVDEAKRWYAGKLQTFVVRGTDELPSTRTHVDNIRKTPGPFTDPIAGTQEAIDQFDSIKVLYVSSSERESVRKMLTMPQCHV